ncbi:tyrosine-protein phosphatase [Amphritea sp. HPY]|uniref:tyrosine-protein phosphatase n=1 Tax=Amphritea sp. HPY TaxID=3421652 RepID=UPI003D7CB658
MIATAIQSLAVATDMIDLHCHILPGIDDGADCMDTAVGLARQAVADGICHSVVTPHIHPGRYSNTAKSIVPVFNRFKSRLSKLDIPLQVTLAAEIRLSPELITMVTRDQVPYIGTWNGFNVILLELPHSHVPPGTEELIRWLKEHNILPVIAHPERNKELMQRIDKLSPLIEQGCLLQLTAMSVTGEFGPGAKHTAELILQRDWASFIATDSHHLLHRPAILSKGARAAAYIIGAAKADTLIYTNPQKLLSPGEQSKCR